MTGPSDVPFLNQDLQLEAQAVRGMNIWVCSWRSATASKVGEMDLMPSIWHFLITLTTYFAMCSLIVNTLPCPAGAFGPRKAES